MFESQSQNTLVNHQESIVNYSTTIISNKLKIKMPPSPNSKSSGKLGDVVEALEPEEIISVGENNNLNKSPTITPTSNSEIDKDILKLEEPTRIVWRNVGIFVSLHYFALIGLYKLLSGQIMWQTFLWGAVFYCFSVIGVGAGCHRLWSHKSYKAKLPLRIILAAFQTIAFQNHIYEWSRDHRVHHKYSETQADPHNAKRGFFFAHVGWLLCRKNKAVKAKGAGIDLSDLKNDPVVMFQKKYYVILGLTISFYLPILIPMYFWGESFSSSFHMTILRYISMLHVTWCVNSVAHMFGPRPYDKSINPAQVKLLSIFCFGEGWHNYHHVFPWDYKTAELGIYRYNVNTLFIDFFAKIGWAYDLKSVPKHIVMSRVAKYGDGTYLDGHNHKSLMKEDQNIDEIQNHHDLGPGPWSLEDCSSKSELEITETLYPLKNQ